ncbi:MAG: hypothetical protein AB7P99_02080 [Vicinamibacterales bacterium]
MTLIIAMLCTIMLLALGGALMSTAATERQAAAAEDRGREAFHAAEAVAERALADLAQMPDWATALDGSAQSAFVDGPPSGGRVFGAVSLDLGVLTAEVDGWSTGDGPWRPFAYGPIAQLLPGEINSPMYAVAWVNADPDRPGAVLILAHAYGPAGTRRMIELAIERAPFDAVRLVSWREYRQ